MRPRGGPIYAATGVPTTRVTHQCARVTPGRRIRAVTARGERYSTRYEPGRWREREGIKLETGPARALPGVPGSSMTYPHARQGPGRQIGTF